MAQPIAWQIQEDLKMSLEDIDGSGDYFYNIAVEYVEYDQNTLNALDAEIQSVSIDRNDDRQHQSKVDWNQTFAITVSVPVGPDIEGEHDQRLMRAFSDVSRAVMADPRRNELAQDTAVLGYEPSEKGSKRLACTVSVMVMYRTDEQDLTSK